MTMTRRQLLTALLVAPFTPRLVPEVHHYPAVDRETGISIRYVQQWEEAPRMDVNVLAYYEAGRNPDTWD